MKANYIHYSRITTYVDQKGIIVLIGVYSLVEGPMF